MSETNDWEIFWCDTFLIISQHLMKISALKLVPKSFTIIYMQVSFNFFIFDWSFIFRLPMLALIASYGLLKPSTWSTWISVLHEMSIILKKLLSWLFPMYHFNLTTLLRLNESTLWIWKLIRRVLLYCILLVNLKFQDVMLL